MDDETRMCINAVHVIIRDMEDRLRKQQLEINSLQRICNELLVKK